MTESYGITRTFNWGNFSENILKNAIKTKTEKMKTIRKINPGCPLPILYVPEKEWRKWAGRNYKRNNSRTFSRTEECEFLNLKDSTKYQT